MGDKDFPFDGNIPTPDDDNGEGDENVKSAGDVTDYLVDPVSGEPFIVQDRKLGIMEKMLPPLVIVLAALTLFTSLPGYSDFMEDHNGSDGIESQEESRIGDEPIDTPDYTNTKIDMPVVSVGDSTMALSAGVIEDMTGGCRHEVGRWSELVGVDADLSCAGASANKITSIVNKSRAIWRDTKTVYITAGTNSIRQHHGDLDAVAADMKRLYRAVAAKAAPKADIIMVGYLPVNQGQCMTPKQLRNAEYLDTIHSQANDIMIDIAKEHRLRYISVDSLDNYNPCDPDSTYIRLPGTTKGASWHTTPAGHKAIAKVVKDYLARDVPPMVPDSLDDPTSRRGDHRPGSSTPGQDIGSGEDDVVPGTTKTSSVPRPAPAPGSTVAPGSPGTGTGLTPPSAPGTAPSEGITTLPGMAVTPDSPSAGGVPEIPVPGAGDTTAVDPVVPDAQSVEPQTATTG